VDNICGNCGGRDHLRKGCKHEAKCVNCQGPHRAGAAVCQARREAINKDMTRLAKKAQDESDATETMTVIERAENITDMEQEASARGLYSAAVIGGIRIPKKNSRSRSQSVKNKTNVPSEKRQSRNGKNVASGAEVQTDQMVNNATEIRLQKLDERLEALEKMMHQFESLERVVNKLEMIMSELMKNGNIRIEDESEKQQSANTSLQDQNYHHINHGLMAGTVQQQPQHQQYSHPHWTSTTPSNQMHYFQPQLTSQPIPQHQAPYQFGAYLPQFAQQPPPVQSQPHHHQQYQQHLASEVPSQPQQTQNSSNNLLQNLVGAAGDRSREPNSC
jgi:hypothetical protein